MVGIQCSESIRFFCSGRRTRCYARGLLQGPLSAGEASVDWKLAVCLDGVKLFKDLELGAVHHARRACFERYLKTGGFRIVISMIGLIKFEAIREAMTI